MMYVNDELTCTKCRYTAPSTVRVNTEDDTLYAENPYWICSKCGAKHVVATEIVVALVEDECRGVPQEDMDVLCELDNYGEAVKSYGIWVRKQADDSHKFLTKHERVSEAYGQATLSGVGYTYNKYLDKHIYWDALDQSTINAEVVEWYNSDADKDIKYRWHLFYPDEMKELAQMQMDSGAIEINFEFDGMMIASPFYDTTGRMEVDPIDYYGPALLNSDWARFLNKGFHIAYTKKDKLEHKDFYGTWEMLEEWLQMNICSLKGFDPF